MVFGNLAIELEQPAPLFSAQRRGENDTGELALDPPESFILRAASVRGITKEINGFLTNQDTYVFIDLDQVQESEPFFESEADSHLHLQAGALDTGVLPVELHPDLSVSTSLDGVSRQERLIDRGAYEQGY